MPAAAPVAPPPSAAPAQPAKSAPPPAAKAPSPAPAPKTAPAPSPSSPKPSKPGVKAQAQPEKPAEPPKDLDTIESAFDGIKKLAGVDAEELLGEESAKEQEQAPPAKEDVKETDEDEANVTDDQKAPEEEAQTEVPKLGNKPSPWKLVEHYKGLNTNLQREIAELRGKTSGELPKEHSERLTALEKRNQELEQHMRYVDYSKSQEYVDKYQKPYEEAWTRAIGGLKGLKLQFTDPNTAEVVSRDLTPQDIAALANMEPAAARVEIKHRFPEDAAEVRGYIDKIRDLADAQNKALEEQKTKGGDWQKQQQEKVKSVQETNGKLWAQFNKEAAEKLETLRPVEGDDERNMKLEKATNFVQTALAANANDPNLSDDQRAEVIKRHVAVRNRAIAYSVLMHENKSLKAQLAEKEAALKAFDESAPTDGNGKGKQPSGDGGVTIDGIAAMISKLGR